MTDMDRRRRRRRRLLILALLATVGGLVVLTALDQLGKDRAGIIAASLSVVAAAAAWEAAGRASDTAEEARRTAEIMARIERERWPAEFTPKFEFTLTKEGDHAAKLLVHLARTLSAAWTPPPSGSGMTTTTTPRPSSGWGTPTRTVPPRNRSPAQVWGHSVSGPGSARPTSMVES
ncbi:hypothetical protein [Streptomyces sp. NBC_01304]|uniref:hypothetical protein n=1 Tax=Streptomyces sp. NBC_01304 TaxID=2903818 RepID=UPI002E166C2C|nr:hypothetical protein OG430_41730 [Streptomyces sp. NBC_01304]